jgi:drug/metabolite transporter (DMT)-like permease
MKVLVLTTVTLLAFAANSLFCRMALGGMLIDPISFTTIRLISGALALMVITKLVVEPNSERHTKSSWVSGFALFAYAAAFSWAYLSLSTGMGALILFGSVQVTMIGAALRSGERLGIGQWLGSIVAICGLVYLVFPGIMAPDPLGAVLMSLSGVAWGIYSIRGRGVSAPVAVTSGNFLRATPFAILTGALALSGARFEMTGVLLAVISGVVTSGLGYVLWYKTLPSLTTAQASLVQLVVPVIAAMAGVAFLSEILSMRLVAASALILGGVGFAVVKRASKSNDTYRQA